MQSIYTKEELERMREILLLGLPTEELIEKHGFSRGSVPYWKIKLGIPRNKRNPKRKRIAQSNEVSARCAICRMKFTHLAQHSKTLYCSNCKHIKIKPLPKPKLYSEYLAEAKKRAPEKGKWIYDRKRIGPIHYRDIDV